MNDFAYFLHFIRRTFLFGIIGLLIGKIGFSIGFNDLSNGMESESFFQSIFSTLAVLSIVGLPLTLAIEGLFYKLSHKEDSYFPMMMARLGYDLILPVSSALMLLKIIMV